MEILSKNHLSKILKYKQKKFIEQDSLLLVEGYRILKQISDYDITFEELYVLKDNPYKIDNFKYRRIFEVSKYYFEKMSRTKTPQYISALIRYTPLPFPKNYHSILFLDKISDPGNLGTIIRTALSFGIDGIVLSENSVSFLNDKTVRASLGAIFKMSIKYQNYTWFKNEKSVKIIADVSENAILLSQLPKIDKPKIIVIGSEAHGVSDVIKEIADYRVKIPVKNMESLNAAVSAAILMYHFL